MKGFSYTSSSRIYIQEGKMGRPKQMRKRRSLKISMKGFRARKLPHRASSVIPRNR
jgi:hypothetical protein